MHRKRSFWLAVPALFPVLLLALLPLGATAQAAADDTRHCTPPAATGNGSTIAIALDWLDEPVTPGTRHELGVRVTNTGSEPTTEPTLVAVHNFESNAIDGSGLPGFQSFNAASRATYEIPAGLAPGATDIRQVPIQFNPYPFPGQVERCGVSAFNGDDCATATYETTVGQPVVDMSATVSSPTAKPGETVAVPVTLHNAGPSHMMWYDYPVVVTLKAPADTTWADDGPFGSGCTVDAARTTKTCEYVQTPPTGGAFPISANLTMAPDAVPGTTLDGGLITVTSAFDPDPFPGAPFSVTVA